MTTWPDFSFLGYVEALYFLPLAVGLTLLIYARTNPAPTKRLRRVLACSRCLALLSILIVLAEPQAQFLEKVIVRPRLALLLDSSTSMETVEGGISRIDRVRSLLESREFGSVLDRVEVQAYGFDETSRPFQLEDLLQEPTGGRATDISTALRKGVRTVKESDAPLSVLLLTDGVHNLGEDPVETAAELGVPVFSLQSGVGEETADVQVVETQAPDIGYVGQRLVVRAVVQSSGFAGRTEEIVLYQGDEVVSRQRHRFAADGERQTVQFEVVPQLPGPTLFRVAVPNLAGDRSTENNQSSAFVRILDDKVETLVLAGGPGADLTFAGRSLAADSTLSVRTMTGRSDEDFYEGVPDPAEWAGVNVFVVLDPGSKLMQGRVGEAIAARVRGGAGMLFVGGERTFGAWEDSPVTRLLPVSPNHPEPRFTAGPVALQLGQSGLSHPVTRPSSAEPADDPWTRLPPLPGYFPLTRLAPGAMVLVEGNQSRIPVVSVGHRERGRVIAVASAHLWRLDLLSSGVGDSPQTIRDFWAHAVRWLATASPSGRVRVSSERNVYKGGEEVVVIGQVLDELFRPLEDADLLVTLEMGEAEIKLLQVGSGNYRGGLRGLDPGEYTFSASARVAGQVVGEDEGNFIVEQHSVESITVKPDDLLLSEIARVSGGRTAAIDDWRQLIEAAPLHRRLVERRSVVTVWDHQWIVIAAILLLAIEWYIRKQQGLV